MYIFFHFLYDIHLIVKLVWRRFPFITISIIKTKVGACSIKIRQSFNLFEQMVSSLRRKFSVSADVHTKSPYQTTMSNKWVSALHDYSAGINSLPTCIGLSDLYGDGDYKLIIGDIGTGKYNMRLKVFKGLTLIGESVLTDVPSAVVPFINELVGSQFFVSS